MKWVIHFHTERHGPELTNIQLIAKVLGTEETDEWAARKSSCLKTQRVFGGNSLAVSAAAPRAIRTRQQPVH